MTLTEYGGSSALKVGDKFRVPDSYYTDYYEVLEPLTTDNQYVGFNTIKVKQHFTDGTTSDTDIYAYELDNGYAYSGAYVLDEIGPCDTQKVCWHTDKKAVFLFVSAYWLCKNCGRDMGTLTDEEFKREVKGLK